jgi:Hypervirulence associated proteins TUDOR domain
MNTDTKKFEKGMQVRWNWGAHDAYGEIREIFTEKVTRHIKGKAITRNASSEKPAYLLVQENGQEVLKSESELHHL